MMKSLRCRPPILCVHHVTVTLPHSVRSAGWWPSSSASSPTLFVKARACTKLSELNALSKRLIPSTSMIFHVGTCGRNPSISASVSVGSPLRQATHFICVSWSIQPPLWVLVSFEGTRGTKGRASGTSLAGRRFATERRNRNALFTTSLYFLVGGVEREYVADKRRKKTTSLPDKHKQLEHRGPPKRP